MDAYCMRTGVRVVAASVEHGDSRIWQSRGEGHQTCAERRCDRCRGISVLGKQDIAGLHIVSDCFVDKGSYPCKRLFGLCNTWYRTSRRFGTCRKWHEDLACCVTKCDGDYHRVLRARTRTGFFLQDQTRSIWWVASIWPVGNRANSAELCAGQGLLSQAVMVAALLRFLAQREESIGHVDALDGCNNTVNERRDWMDSSPASHWAEIDYTGQGFRGFPQSLHVFGCMVPQPKPWLHNSTSNPVHYSVILSFDAI
jgi:hypothetical protein